MDAEMVNFSLLDRLRSAFRREMALTTSLASEIIAATTHLARCTSDEREAGRHAVVGDRRLDGLTDDERNDMQNAAAGTRAGLRRVERLAGRPAVTEQSVLARVADAARQAGGSIDRAVQEFARASAGDRQATRQAAQQAYEAATQARVRAERALQELEAERAQHGRRAGLLRLTLQQAETWLAANGLAFEAAA